MIVIYNKSNNNQNTSVLFLWPNKKSQNKIYF